MKFVQKTVAYTVVVGLTAFTLGAQGIDFRMFQTPPSEAKSRVWWHWMNGNVTKAGITADLEAMAEAGIGGAHIFDVGCNVPPGPVKFNTPNWDEHIRFAAAEAERLGLELTLANCSGFANAGGPWITASNSMFFVTCSETPVKGGAAFRGVLPRTAKDNGFYRDIAVLAFPRPGIEAQAPKGLATRRPAGTVCEFAADDPFTIRGISFTLNMGPGWAWTRWMDLAVEVSEDGRTWRETFRCSDCVTSDGKTDCVGEPKRMVFPKPVTGRRIRLAADFSRGFSVHGTNVTFKTIEPEFRSGMTDLNARTFRAKTTTFARLPEDGVGIDPSEILDLTERFNPADGTLAWDVPAGDWIVLRIGYRSSGIRNHPSSEFGEGYEVDKLDAAAVARHFDAYVGRFADLKAVVGLLCDSYEVGPQNWTHGFERRFEARYGFSLVPYLAAFSGRIVGSAERTDTVLRQFRELISDEFASCFMGTLRRKCAAHGITSAIECYGGGPVSALTWSRNADIPMTEFWVKAEQGATDRPDRCDGELTAKIAAADAHIRGKRFVDAEAFTAQPDNSGRWLKDPYGLKPFGDVMYCAGVNRMVFHRFAHQPWTKPARLPGMTMGQWGTHFERTETWWPMVGPFLRYQARCQYLLQQGRFAGDVLFYTGDEVPNDARPEVDPPRGFDWDVCDRDVLKALRVEKGRLITPGGTDYAVLVVPTNRLICAESRDLFKKLEAAGARVVTSADPLGLEPDFTYTGSATNLRFIHRRYDGGMDGYFVASPSTNAVTANCSFRIAGRFPQVWDAETGARWRPQSWRNEGERTVVTVRFRPCGSIFVMFSDREDEAVPVEQVPHTLREVPVKGPWKLSFPAGWRCPAALSLASLRSWTEIPDGEVRYFSGIATYETEVKAGGDGGCVILDLGEVKNVAEVTVNGKTYPALWRPPFKVDVTDALTKGGQALSLRIRVANLWPNRLIGDAKLPEDCEWGEDCVSLKRIPDWVQSGKPSPTGRLTFTTWKHWSKDAPLLESGLLGPVKLEIVR